MLSALDDQELVALLRRHVKSGQLVVLHTCEGGGANEVSQTAEQRRLVREIEAKSRRKLNYSGRRYKLVADTDLHRLRDRDSYEVVSRRDAEQVLEGLANQSGAAASELGALLAKASEKLTADWRPPREPDGLVLLRRIIIQASHAPDTGPALTPSQIEKLLKKPEWIEIEVVDETGAPYTGHYRLELPDETVIEGQLDAEGFYGNYAIDTGTCKLYLGEKGAAVASFDAACDAQPSAPPPPPPPPEPTGSAPAATTESTPITLRFKLLDLLGRPISGAEVTVAGAAATSDGDGMVEVDVSQGAGSVPATLPGGDVGLNVGGLDPADAGSASGWKTRLFNMGFLWDPDAAEGEDEMIIALQDFQAQYQIETSGQLDEATKAKLVEVHGC